MKWTGPVTATRRAGLDVITHSPDQTRELGAALARRLSPGDLVLLSGTLGSGKTTFIQGIATGLGIEDQVTSPTFTLVAEYSSEGADGLVRLHHVDLYRLGDEGGDLYSFGLDEILDDPDAISAVEWPQRAGGVLPDEYLLVELVSVADTKRRVRFFGRGRNYQHLVSDLRSEAGRGRS